jgi:protein subunit release factor B
MQRRCINIYEKTSVYTYQKRFCCPNISGRRKRRTKTSSGVRITHPDSGASAECRETRSQYQNKEIAFTRLLETYKFKRWMNLKITECVKKQTLEEEVDIAMDKENLVIEYKENGKWKRLEEDNENHV